MKIELKLMLLVIAGFFLSCGFQKADREFVKIEQTEAILPIILLGDTTNALGEKNIEVVGHSELPIFWNEQFDENE